MKNNATFNMREVKEDLVGSVIGFWNKVVKTSTESSDSSVSILREHNQTYQVVNATTMQVIATEIKTIEEAVSLANHYIKHDLYLDSINNVHKISNSSRMVISR